MFIVVVTGRAFLPHRHGGRPRRFVQCLTLYDVNSKCTASSRGTSDSGKENRKRQLYVHNDVLCFLARDDDHDHDSYVSYDDEKEEKEEDDESLEEEGEE